MSRALLIPAVPLISALIGLTSCASIVTSFVHPSLRVRVVNRSGEPVVGALVAATLLEDEILAPLPRFVPGGRAPTWVAWPEGDLQSSTRTDAAGDARFWLPDLGYREVRWRLPWASAARSSPPLPSFELHVQPPSDSSGARTPSAIADRESDGLRLIVGGPSGQLRPAEADAVASIETRSDATGTAHEVLVEVQCVTR